MSKKIGIMGGSFNPPHTGHLSMAKCVKDALNLDEVWFIPTGNVAYKDKTERASAKDRLAMVNLMVADIPEFSVDTIETDREENSYTFETMESLRKLFPETEFVFIVGADSLDYMDLWREPARILASCTVAAVNRNGISSDRAEEKRRFLMEKFGGDIVLVDMPEINVSSTEIRELIKSGKDVTGMVSDDVLSYIREHNLYL